MIKELSHRFQSNLRQVLFIVVAMLTIGSGGLGSEGPMIPSRLGGIYFTQTSAKVHVAHAFEVITCNSTALPIGSYGFHPAPHGRGGWFRHADNKEGYVGIYETEKRCLEEELYLSILRESGVLYERVDGDFHISDFALVDEATRQAILDELNRRYRSRMSLDGGYPVSYVLTESGKIDELTKADYGASTPVLGRWPEDIDFGLIVATNFGLRTYRFAKNGEHIAEFGDFDTAFYSVEVNDGIVYLSQPGAAKVFRLTLEEFQVVDEIAGISITGMRSVDSKLLMAGFKGADWNQSSLFVYDPRSRETTMVETVRLGDCRGLVAIGDRLYVSDGASNRIAVLGREDFQLRYYWYGFRYPNGLSATRTGSLLVADEHAGVVRELDPKSGVELRAVGFGVFASPAYAEEVRTGIYRGHWIVADADNNRVVLIDPSSCEVKAEIRNLRSAFHFRVLEHEQ